MLGPLGIDSPSLFDLFCVPLHRTAGQKGARNSAKCDTQVGSATKWYRRKVDPDFGCLMTRTLQKRIHATCRALGIDADTRREMQMEVCGKTSTRDMNKADLELVVAHLNKIGGQSGIGRRPAAPRADLRLVHVLWRKLGDRGALERPDRDGLNAFIRRRFGDSWASVPADVDMLRDPKQIEAIIRALKSWGQREGIDFDWGRK